MVLKLYGWTQCTSTKLVATVLHEKQIPFEYVDIDLMTYENRAPEFLAMQPFGQVPVIDDDGFILYESRAIARYLEENHHNQGPKLIPSDPKKRALFDQAASAEAFSFDRYGTPLVGEIIFKRRACFTTWYTTLIIKVTMHRLRGGETDLNKVKVLTEILGRKLDVYEQILSKQNYVAGDELTLADIYHLPVLGLFPKAQITLLQERPNVAAWFERVSSRASWQKVKDGVANVDA